MQLIWIFLIITHILSTAFMGLCFLRVIRFRKRYMLQESSYSMLLGFIHLDHILIAYVLTVALSIAVSTSFVFFLSSQ